MKTSNWLFISMALLSAIYLQPLFGVFSPCINTKTSIQPLTFSSQLEYQKFVKIAGLLNPFIKERTNMGTSLGDETLATFGNQRVVFNSLGKESEKAPLLKQVEQLQPLEFQNQKHYETFFNIARRLNGHVVERTGMGLNRGDYTLARFNNKRIILQTS